MTIPIDRLLFTVMLEYPIMDISVRRCDWSQNQRIRAVGCYGALFNKNKKRSNRQSAAPLFKELENVKISI